MLTRLFKRGQRPFARLIGRRIAQTCRGLRNRAGYVLRIEQYVRELRGAALFIGSIRCREAQLDQALVLGRQFREAGFHTMVVGKDQTLG